MRYHINKSGAKHRGIEIAIPTAKSCLTHRLGTEIAVKIRGYSSHELLIGGIRRKQKPVLIVHHLIEGLNICGNHRHSVGQRLTRGYRPASLM